MDSKTPVSMPVLSILMRVETVFPFFLAPILPLEAQAAIALVWVINNYFTELHLARGESRWWLVMGNSIGVNAISYGLALTLGATFLVPTKTGSQFDFFKLEALAKLVFGLVVFVFIVRSLAYGADKWLQKRSKVLS